MELQLVWLLCNFRPKTQQTLISQSIYHVCGERRPAPLSAGEIGTRLGSHGDVLLTTATLAQRDVDGLKHLPLAAQRACVRDKNVLFIRPLLVTSYYTNGSLCLEADFKWQGSHILMKMRETCFAIRNKDLTSSNSATCYVLITHPGP